MKIHAWTPDAGTKEATPARRARGRLALEILRAAYRRFAKDAATRRAVKQCLR
jgi:hypothetical protein